MKKRDVQNIMEAWSDPVSGEVTPPTSDWRSLVDEKMKEGDVRGMRKVALPSVQRQIIELAHESSSEQVRLQASQLVMGQEGEGPVQRIEHGINYRQIPQDQLSAMLASKLARMQKLIPGFTIEGLMEKARERLVEAPIKAEYSEEIPETTL